MNGAPRSCAAHNLRCCNRAALALVHSLVKVAPCNIDPGSDTQERAHPQKSLLSTLLGLHFRGMCVLSCFRVLSILDSSMLSSVRLRETLWSVAHQTPLSMGFSRQEYEVGCHALLQGICPTQGSNLLLAGEFFTT